MASGNAVLEKCEGSSPSIHLVSSLCGKCPPHLWTWTPPGLLALAQIPPITHRRPEHPKTPREAPPPT